ncbi:MAG: hypothetical protein DRP45_02735 [Candidatus Zixiibacteriota bacterium]|nr:MAG: hypothetical protein DRP45_02735 [candidate division Zixibacteria bacterium]
MDIGFIYSRKDPRQAKARDFLKKYLKERGVLARVIETEREVTSPTIIINGHTLKDLRQKPREDSPAMFPSIDDIVHMVERQVWCL